MLTCRLAGSVEDIKNTIMSLNKNPPVITGGFNIFRHTLALIQFYHRIVYEDRIIPFRHRKDVRRLIFSEDNKMDVGVKTGSQYIHST
jgi:hypothetical protein